MGLDAGLETARQTTAYRVGVWLFRGALLMVVAYVIAALVRGDLDLMWLTVAYVPLAVAGFACFHEAGFGIIGYSADVRARRRAVHRDVFGLRSR